MMRLVLDRDPRRLISAWGSQLKPTPAQRLFLAHPDQLMQWGGSIATGGSTAVLYGAYSAGKTGRALVLCPVDRFRRTFEAVAPTAIEEAPMSVVLLESQTLLALHRDLSSPWMRFDYIGVLGSVGWEVSQVLLALLAPGGKLRARPDIACPHLGEIWSPVESSTGLELLETLARKGRLS